MKRKIVVVLIFVLFIFAGCGSNGAKKKSVESENDSDSPVTEGIGTDNSSDEDGGNQSDSDVTAVCGDGKVEGSEKCDGTVDLCTEIDPMLYKAGKAKCLDDCSGWDTATCEEVSHECGNDIREGPEKCDGTVDSCSEIDPERYVSGKAKCLDDCSGWDTVTCVEKEELCGNGSIDENEVCDSTTKACAEVDPLRYESGTAECLDDCSGWDTSSCVEIQAECGDGITEGAEVCDDELILCTKINPVKYKGGKAYCLDDCSGWDTVTCEEYETPDDDSEIPDQSCVDECAAAGQMKCEGTFNMKCEMGSGGCYEWQVKENCSDDGLECRDNAIVGDDTDNNERELVFKGNYIHCENSMKLKSFDVLLNFTGEKELTFAVFESSEKHGTYTKIAERKVSYSGGNAFFNSGNIKDSSGDDITLENGKYYLIGVGWEQMITSYYKSGQFFLPHDPTYFAAGKTMGGTATENTWPVPESFEGSSMNATTYFHRYELDPVNDLCNCDNSCDLNRERCADDMVELCSTDANGCTMWVDYNNCATYSEPHKCQEDGNSATCVR